MPQEARPVHFPVEGLSEPQRDSEYLKLSEVVMMLPHFLFLYSIINHSMIQLPLLSNKEEDILPVL